MSHGVTAEHFDQMLAEQDVRCAICREAPPGTSTTTTKPREYAELIEHPGVYVGLPAGNLADPRRPAGHARPDVERHAAGWVGSQHTD